MPVSAGGKRSFRRRRNYRRKPWYKKKYSVGEIAGKALSGVNYLRTLVNAEVKTYDSTLAAQSLDYNGHIYNLTAIPQGDTEQSRDGNSIFLKSIFIRGLITANTVTENNTVRVIIFRDTMNLGSSPTIGEILESTGSNIATLSPLNHDSHGRFQILWTKFFTFSNNGNTAQVWKAYLPIRKHVKYTGTLGTDEHKGQIYILLLSNTNVNHPQGNYQARVSFYDN